jgi:hypothetical protein
VPSIEKSHCDREGVHCAYRMTTHPNMTIVVTVVEHHRNIRCTGLGFKSLVNRATTASLGIAKERTPGQKAAMVYLITFCLSWRDLIRHHHLAGSCVGCQRWRKEDRLVGLGKCEKLAAVCSLLRSARWRRAPASFNDQETSLPFAKTFMFVSRRCPSTYITLRTRCNRLTDSC